MTAILWCRSTTVLEQFGLLEVFGRDQHQVEARLRFWLWLWRAVQVVVLTVVLGPGATLRLVGSGFVGVQQRAALVQAKPLGGGPTRPLRAHQRVRTAPVDQSPAEGVLARSGKPHRAAQAAARRNLSERIAQPTHVRRNFTGVSVGFGTPLRGAQAGGLRPQSPGLFGFHGFCQTIMAWPRASSAARRWP